MHTYIHTHTGAGERHALPELPSISPVYIHIHTYIHTKKQTYIQVLEKGTPCLSSPLYHLSNTTGEDRRGRLILNGLVDACVYTFTVRAANQVCVCVCMYVYMYVCVYVRVCEVCDYVHMCMYVFLRTCT